MLSQEHTPTIVTAGAGAPSALPPQALGRLRLLRYPQGLAPLLVLALALSVAAFSLVPTWLGYRQASPPDRVFMGFRYMEADFYQYAALIRQAQETNRPWRLQNPFTHEPQDGRFALLYVAARLTKLEIPPLWFIGQALAAFLYVLVFWHFVGHYVETRGQRAAATAIFALGGGFNWVSVLLRGGAFDQLAQRLSTPSKFFWNWSTFGTLVVSPWVWAALSFMLACHLLLRERPRAHLFSFVLLPVCWFVHPYTGIVAYLAIGLLPFAPIATASARLEPIPWNRVRGNLRLAAPGLLSFAVVLAHQLWARGDSVYREVANRLLRWRWTDEAGWYFVAYGALLPLALVGAASLFRQHSARSDLLFSWLGAALFLSVNPWFAAVKFQYLVFPPLALLASVGLFSLRRSYPRVRKATSSAAGVAATVLLLGLDAPVMVLKDARSDRFPDELFLPQAEIDAMRWLGTRPKGVVLSTKRSGNLIPWLAGQTVFLGHWFLTPEGDARSKDVERFFDADGSLEHKRSLLERARARYVYYGRPEQASGAVDPRLGLDPIYDRDGVKIFEVPSQHPYSRR